MSLKKYIATRRADILRWRAAQILNRAGVADVDWKARALESKDRAAFHDKAVSTLINERSRERARSAPLWIWLEDHGVTQKGSPSIVALAMLKRQQEALHAAHEELAESIAAREQMAADLDAMEERAAYRAWSAPQKIDLDGLSDEARALLEGLPAMYQATENPALVSIAQNLADSTRHGESRDLLMRLPVTYKPQFYPAAPSAFYFPENGGPQ